MLWELIGAYLFTSGAVSYIGEAVLLGSWRRQFGDYSFGLWEMPFIAFLPIIGPIVVMGFSLTSFIKDRAIDLDWPFRLKHDGRTKEEWFKHVMYTLPPMYTTFPPGSVVRITNGGNGFPPPTFSGNQPPSPPFPPPDPDVSNTFGYRTWFFKGDGLLHSPIMDTPWLDEELRCETWAEGEAVRGVAGIHAHLVPRDWRKQQERDDPDIFASVILGIVERTGKFVLGTEGWRSEVAIIRALHAPNRAIAAALAVNYPQAEITWRNQNEHW